MEELIEKLIAKKHLTGVAVLGTAVVQTTGGEHVAVAFCSDAGTALGGVQCRIQDLEVVAGKFLDELKSPPNPQ